MPVDHSFQTLRQAARSLAKQPSYSAVVITTLGFAIAANALIFSLMNPYFFRPLPFLGPERLVQLGHVDPVNQWDGARFSYPQLRDYAARARSFDDLAAYRYSSVNLTGDAGAERVTAGELTTNMLALLGVAPRIGPGFAPTGDGLGEGDVVLLGNGLWERRFAGDPQVVGQSLSIDGRPHTIVGVMPETFDFPFPEVRLWRPLPATEALVERERNSLLIVGRLRAGTEVERARQELATLQQGFAADFPDSDGRFAGVSVKPLRQALNFAWDALRIGFAVLLAAVAAVLLIACVNVAGLTLARAAARRREIALRSALGAPRGRLIGQMLTEGWLLACLGGALGIALTYGLVGLLGPLIPEALFRVGGVSVDARVLAFAVAATLLTPCLFGLLPAWVATRNNLVASLKEGSQGAGAGRATLRGRRALVVVEVALAVVLTTGAGLMLRSLWAIGAVDVGFAADEVLAVEVTLPAKRFTTPADQEAYFRRSVEALRAVPGVRSVAAVSHLPLNHETLTVQHARPGRAPEDPEAWPVGLQSRAAPSYFETMGITVREGRGFLPTDRVGGDAVVVISQQVAERHWAGGSAIGQMLTFGDPQAPKTARVVGVVGDVRYEDLTRADTRGHIYQPLLDSGQRRRFLVIANDRTASERAVSGLIPEVSRILAEIDPGIAVSARPMTALLGESALLWRISSIFLAVFGAVAMVLAAIGLYGLMAYSFALRQQELGVRAALGASGRDLRGLVLGEGLRLTGLGVLVGIPLALVAGRLATSVLFGVSPLDPLTLGAIIVLMVVIALVASVGPALRAERIDPVSVLRGD